MCTFLYGGINEDVNRYDYTITPGDCNCDTSVGQGDAEHPEIKELAEYINTLQSIRHIKWVCIAKKWCDDDIEETQTVHISDIDLPYLLANIKENCLYEIRMFHKYS